MKEKWALALCAVSLCGAVMAEPFPNSYSKREAGDVDIWPEGRIPSVQTNQCVPWIRWYVPQEVRTDACLIVCPGGGYSGWGHTSEGEEICAWANSLGMTAVLFRYRTPRPIGLDKHVTAWQDAQRTIRLVRAAAKEKGFSPENIGFIGFSAGGHLTLMSALSSQTPAYAPVDEIDRLPCHLNWAVPVYPAYVLSDGYDCGNTTKGNDLSLDIAPEFAFDAGTPKKFIFFHGDEDQYSPMASLRIYNRLRTMGVSSEVHIVATRGHCFHFYPKPKTGTFSAKWLETLGAWLRQTEIVK